MLPLFTHKNLNAERGGRHRRKAGGCKKALNDKHVWGQPQRWNYAIDQFDEPLGYTLEICTQCGKKNYTWN